MPWQLQLWAGLWLFDPRAADIQAIEGWKVPSFVSWPGGVLWLMEKSESVKEKEDRKRKERGMASFIYPTAPIHVSKVA